MAPCGTLDGGGRDISGQIGEIEFAWSGKVERGEIGEAPLVYAVPVQVLEANKAQPVEHGALRPAAHCAGEDEVRQSESTRHGVRRKQAVAQARLKPGTHPLRDTLLAPPAEREERNPKVPRHELAQWCTSVAVEPSVERGEEWLEGGGRARTGAAVSRIAKGVGVGADGANEVRVGVRVAGVGEVEGVATPHVHIARGAQELAFGERRLVEPCHVMLRRQGERRGQSRSVCVQPRVISSERGSHSRL